MKYRFRTDRPWNEDKLIIILTRYHTRELADGMQHNDIMTEVLTEDGWEQVARGAVMPSNLPSIDGRELLNISRVHALLADMEDRIKQAIREQEDNGTSEESTIPIPASEAEVFWDRINADRPDRQGRRGDHEIDGFIIGTEGPRTPE